MKNLTQKRWLNLFLSIVLLSFFLTSCENSTGNNEDPPEIPPESSLIMDFSDFSNSIPLGKNNTATETMSKNNWAWAAINVAVARVQ